jgi:hypothetical protein
MTSELVQVEYRIKEKTVYFITRYCQFGDGGSITEEGEFRDILSAHRAASAMRNQECIFQGVDQNDPRIIGPEPLQYSNDPA